MAYITELDDIIWEEVVFLNSYALFMGYISMAIKGLGFLILTWTTVVLLGGFVSMLQKKDFWCLTFITLVQTAGIFDVHQTEKLSYIATSVRGMMGGVIFGVLGKIDPYCRENIPSFIARALLATAFAAVQVLVFAILLCPLAAIFVFGLLISSGISIWRLIQHDYGGNSDGEANLNLKPAMDTLYYLALLQGLLFCYRFLFSRTEKRLANQVVVEHDHDEDREVVLTYCHETRIGCEKDPSFAKGRNLTTHALDLIGSKSRDECLSGVKMLYTVICMAEKKLKNARVASTNMTNGQDNEWCRLRWVRIIGQHMMMKNLITSASSSPVLQKLLQTLDPRGSFDRETRNQGATILAHLALDIHLEQFPGAIQHISTLIGSFQEYHLIEPYHRERLLYKYDQDWDRRAARLPLTGNPANELRETYEKLVLAGFRILWKLATHENNCRIISHTQGLLPRIMAPLTSDIIHQFNGGAWSIGVVEESLKVMFQLVAAPGETGAKLRQEIWSNEDAIATIERIRNCDCCSAKLQKRAMGVLIQLYSQGKGHQEIRVGRMDTKSRETYIKMLVLFVDDNKDMSIRKLAGEALAKLCNQDGSNTSIILQVKGDVVGRLTKILLLDDAENRTCRIRAAEILEQMCIHHKQDDEFLRKLKKDMTDTMPKVLAQILHCGLPKDETHGLPAIIDQVLEEILRCALPKDETHGLTEANQVESPKKEADIENQCDNAQHDAAMGGTLSSPCPQNNEDEGQVEAAVAVKGKGKVEVKGKGKGKVKGKGKGKGKVEVKGNVEMDMEVDELDNDEDEEFHAPLLSLFVTVCDTFISVDEDLACQFGAVDAISLPKKLKEMVADNSILTVHCVRLMKLTCKMVISMMKHKGSYLKEDLDSLTEALSSASESMSLLDVSMVFASEDHGAATTMKPVKSLSSLVKEAKESVDAYFKAQESRNIEPFTSIDG